MALTRTNFARYGNYIFSKCVDLITVEVVSASGKRAEKKFRITSCRSSELAGGGVSDSYPEKVWVWEWSYFSQYWNHLDYFSVLRVIPWWGQHQLGALVKTLTSLISFNAFNFWWYHQRFDSSKHSQIENMWNIQNLLGAEYSTGEEQLLASLERELGVH